MALTLTSPPDTDPVSLIEAKVHLKVTYPESDTEIKSLISAASEYVEKALNRDLIQRTWSYTLSGFPAGEIELPKNPVASVTSIEYLDTNGDSQTLPGSVYILDGSSVHLKYGSSWPATANQHGAVTVNFVSGFGEAAAVPQAIKSAILLAVGDLFEHREANTMVRLTPSRTMEMLIRKHRRMVL